ncbi:exonuclease [Gordonia phage SpeedDemon]|nr:exonuclease [Gordonia phage SpeedDemon]
MTYEEGKAKLTAIVQEIERGGLSLDDQLAKWNEARGLIDELEKMLGTYETRVSEGAAA